MVRGFREVSSIARSIAHYYCLHANQTTGECWVAQKTVAEDLEYRLDHIKNYDSELVAKGWIEITPDLRLGRIVRIIKGWQSVEERRQKRRAGTGAGAAVPENSPKFGKPLPQDSGKSSQDSGKSSQDLGKPSQDLGTYDRKNQSFNQPPNKPINQRDLARKNIRQEDSQTDSPAPTSAAGLVEEIFDTRLSVFTSEQLNAEITDLVVWRAVLIEWKMNDKWSPTNYAGMRRYYRETVLKAAKSSGNAYVGAGPTKAPMSAPRVAKKTLPPLPDPPEVWSRLLDDLQVRLPAAQFTTWFKPLVFVALDEVTLTVRAPFSVFEDWILNNFREELQLAMGAVGIEAESVVFESESDLAEG